MDAADDQLASEEASRRSAAEYRALFETAGTGLAEVELGTGRFVRVNRRFCELVGYGPDELLGGMTFLQITHADDRERNVEAVAPVMHGGQGYFEIEKRYVRKDGSVVWVHLTCSPIRDADGKPTRLLGSAHDITKRRRAEDELRASEQRWQLALSASSDGTWDWDLRRHTLFLSPRWKQVRGYLEDEVGTDEAEWSSRIHPDDSERVMAAVRTYLQRRAPAFECEYRTRCKDGRYLWILDRGVAVWDDEGLAVRMVGSETDITARKEAEHALRESEHRLRLAMEAAGTGMWEWDVVTNTVTWSADCYAIHGLRPNGFDGSAEGFDRFVHADDRERVWRAVRDAVDGRTQYQCEFRIVRLDGEVRWVANLGRAVNDEKGRPLRMIGTITDITERKRAEEALIEADRRKDAFLAMLAHELRNPLAPVMNSIELLDRIGSGEPQVVEIRATLRRQMEHMVRLVDDLLDVSRITRDKLELRKRRIELATAIDSAVEANRPLCHSLGHELTVSLPSEAVWLQADMTRVAQVIGNLLNNACKYTPADGGGGGRIALTARRADADVLITVTDNGIGIRPEDLGRVFDPFAQVHADSSLSRGGLGIGLSLVRRLVEMHGGSVEAHSGGLGKGSTFTVRLPVASDPPKVAGDQGQGSSATPGGTVAVAAAATVTPIPKQRILVVDDNTDTARTMARLLMLGGHLARTAHDGPEALAEAEQFRPDLILLDIGLPSMSGYDVCREIRRNSADPKPVMIAVTGWGQEEDRRKSAEAGFDHHLVKPVNFQKLTRLLGELAGNATPSEPAGRQ